MPGDVSGATRARGAGARRYGNGRRCADFGYLRYKAVVVTERAKTFEEFWPHYVVAHSQPATRAFHFVGTLGGWTILIAAIAMRHPWWILAALAFPYALAWISHFFVEHNRPATFGHPIWSLAADQKMVALMLAGKMSREVERCRGIV